MQFQFSFFFWAVYAVCCCVHVENRKLSFWRCRSHASHNSSHTSRFVFLWQLRTVLLCVCVCAYYVGAPSWTQRPGLFQHTLPVKKPAQYSSTTTAKAPAVQRQRPPHTVRVGSYIYELLERLCSPFSTCDTPVFQVQQHPEGEPCIIIHLQPKGLNTHTLPQHIIVSNHYIISTRRLQPRGCPYSGRLDTAMVCSWYAAMLCYVMFHMLCYVMLCYVCYVKLCYAMPCYATLPRMFPYNFNECSAVQRPKRSHSNTASKR